MEFIDKEFFFIASGFKNKIYKEYKWEGLWKCDKWKGLLMFKWSVKRRLDNKEK